MPVKSLNNTRLLKLISLRAYKNIKKNHDIKIISSKIFKFYKKISSS